MNWREQIGVEELKRERPPRGAVVIVAIGLLACLVAAVAATDKGSGEEAHLEWVKQAKIPDSAPAKVPGGDQAMRLTNGKIRSTGVNTSGYLLYQVVETLKIDAEAPIKDARIVCAMSVPSGVEIGHSAGGLRTLYPRSAEGIFTQEVPELKVDFSSHGTEYAAVEVEDTVARFTNEQGVKVEWPEFEEGTEHLIYTIAGKPTKDLELPFFAIWRSLNVVPKATTSCALETTAGKSTVKSIGELKSMPPPIDEEKEDEEQERREGEEAAAEEESDEAGGEGE